MGTDRDPGFGAVTHAWMNRHNIISNWDCIYRFRLIAKAQDRVAQQEMEGFTKGTPYKRFFKWSENALNI